MFQGKDETDAGKLEKSDSKEEQPKNLKEWFHESKAVAKRLCASKVYVLNNISGRFLTAILHRGLRNDFFFQVTSTFFHIIFGLLFPFSIWTFNSLLYLDFSIPFIFGLFGLQITSQ